MYVSRMSYWFFPLIAMSSLIVSNEAVAQSKSTASKRSFAALLARRETGAQPRPVRAAVARERARPVTNHDARSAVVRPLASRAEYGVPAATNVVPPSGYGSGRDAYVEALYPQVLARTATQSDVDYWARILHEGTHANVVAETIWNSQEHRSLERSGTAPSIPLATAYHRAYAWGLLHCKEREAAENRRAKAEDRRQEKD